VIVPRLLGDFMDIDSQVSASAFGRLVNISQQAVSKHVADGHLRKSGTLAEWLFDYCEHLRVQAAGRGGDKQADLAAAKTEEAQVKAALGRLAYNEKLGTLVIAEDAAQAVVNWAAYANREIRGAVERLRQALEKEHGISIDASTLSDVVEPAIERIGEFAGDVAEGLTDSSE